MAENVVQAGRLSHLPCTGEFVVSWEELGDDAERKAYRDATRICLCGMEAKTLEMSLIIRFNIKHQTSFQSQSIYLELVTRTFLCIFLCNPPSGMPFQSSLHPSQEVTIIPEAYPPSAVERHICRPLAGFSLDSVGWSSLSLQTFYPVSL